MTNDGTSPASWWEAVGKNYSIGHEPSGYVAGPGQKFLANGGGRRSGLLADFGCYSGRNLPVLLDLSSRVVGIDHPCAGEILAQAASHHAAVVDFVAARFTALPLADRSVDAGLCWRVLHNLTLPGELEGTLREFNRVLAPGAPILVSVRAAEGAATVPLCQKRDNGAGGTRVDLWFTRAALICSLSVAGFQVQRLDEIYEGEWLDSLPVCNRYWAAQARRHR